MWTVFGAIAASAVAATVYAVRGRSSSLLAPSVYRGPRDRRAVALTFDDGPSPATAAILEILEQHGAKATFFVCGLNAERHPGIVRAAARAGHQIGNHTYSHARLWLRSARFIAEELALAQRAITAITGTPPRWFRPPYGVRWFGLREAQRRLGLTGVMWTCSGRDWHLPAGRVVARLLRAARNGAILCLHDGRELDPTPDASNTIEAVRLLVPALQRRGFALVTVSELLQAAPP
ncbi:MAG: polysaccharide deacetylase family protein [Bryobacterales bacterium]|nr:polysaccharide deacetylase family protein [Bryobacteraceae bacterium]MDW8131650.1 polysaccharide deacetylase family protein [Bryobacterales bacterium]